MWILQHPNEAKHALGTARIASLGLRDCQLVSSVHAHIFAQKSAAQAAPVLIYPSADSAPLSALVDGGTRPLLFLDATWRKSRRMLLESPWLQSLPKYALPAPPPSRYRIRREPSASALSTLEAIAHSLALLEGSTEKYQNLLTVMDSLVDEQIAHMGEAVFARNYPRSLKEEPE